MASARHVGLVLREIFDWRWLFIAAALSALLLLYGLERLGIRFSNSPQIDADNLPDEFTGRELIVPHPRTSP